MIWQRKDLKQNAQYALRDAFWTGFGVIALSSILMSLLMRLLRSLSGTVGIVSGRGILHRLAQSWRELRSAAPNLDGKFWENAFLSCAGMFVSLFSYLLLGTLLFFSLRLLTAVFIRPLFALGRCRWFSRNREVAVPAPFSLLFSLFAPGSYAASVKASFVKNLRLFLWGLPLIFFQILPVYGHFLRDRELRGKVTDWFAAFSVNPRTPFPALGEDNGWGMSLAVIFFASVLSLAWTLFMQYKHYSYYMVDWLLADNPRIGGKRAVYLSRTLMQGNKWRLFLLNLSFGGWYFLSVFGLFLAPVFFWMVDVKRYQTIAEFYAMVRDRAVTEGVLQMEELGYRAVTSAADSAAEQ